MKNGRDDVKRRLYRVVGGTLTADDALRRIENQATDGSWQYATLMDMRAVSSWLTFVQLARVTHLASAIARERGPRGPVAIVVANQALIPVGQAHSIVRSHAGTAAFFRDFETAERWLDAEQSN
jgi:hypothetical protein